MIPTFRPWTHTSDDSYMYQLSLVVATATVSYTWYIIKFSGFYGSMDTSRIIRVGTRTDVIRIAAVSREHVPVYIKHAK